MPNLKKVINSSKVPQPLGPYSQAVIFGDLVYISGMLGVDKTSGQLVEGGIEAQTRQIMTSIGYLLKSSGCTFDDGLKTTIYLKNMNDFEIVNDIYAEVFTGNFPARICIQVVELPMNALIEIDFIAGITPPSCKKSCHN